jgi:outer membrane receptor protein involved in Fe transport
VQVFKGASAVLFGVGAAGSLGGIINYLPKRPTLRRVLRAFSV